jgi:hypothetical protein
MWGDQGRVAGVGRGIGGIIGILFFHFPRSKWHDGKVSSEVGCGQNRNLLILN